MNVELARSFFMWCSIINYGLLIMWCALFVFAHDSYKNFNEIMLRRKIEHFDTLHYAGIGLFKLGIILFNLVPWIVLTFIR
jgi:hypothetical protein